MSASGVSSSPSYKPAETSECAKGNPNHLKAVTHGEECKDNKQLNHETEKKNNEPFDDSSTRVFVFKEVSSLDEDDSCNLGRKNSWCGKLGLVKKIKLSEDGTALISESFENCCEIHKYVRQKEERPYSSEAYRVPKPHLQPTAERGIKKQQRPTTASKLSDIAVNKYPDSIFKVYIPEGNRVIRKKRVVPLMDLKPATPIRSGPSSRGCTEPLRADRTISPRLVGPPLKTKHSIPHQALRNADRRPYNAAGENSDPQICKSGVSGQTPKKMTHITDISLTKEQEKRRLKEREVMRKRTMDAVKMAFPLTGNDEMKPNDSALRVYDSDMSGDEKFKQQGHPSKSKSSLKSYSSVTSCGQSVSGKRSVTWGENEWSDPPMLRNSNNKLYTRKRKKIVHRNLSSSQIGRTDIRSSSKMRLNSGSRSHIRTLKGMIANSNKRENKNISRPKTQGESHQPGDNKNTHARRATTASNSSSDRDQKDDSESEDRCSRERIQKKKHVKDKKPTRRCDCGRVINKKETESEKETESRSDQTAKKKEKKDGQLYNQKYSRNPSEDSFEIKRTAIIRKHSTKDTLASSRRNDNEKNLNIQQESDSDVKMSQCNEEERFHMKRGRSTPSMRKSSTIDSSYGSSDSELCFRKDNNKQYSDHSLVKVSSDEKFEEKPLQKIFDSSNIQNEIPKDELGTIMPTAEIAGSKSFSGSIGEIEQRIEIAETYTEGFKMSQLNMKSVNVVELRSMEDAQLKYLTDEDSIKENLMKEECILNLKSVVEFQSEEAREDSVQNSNSLSNQSNSLVFQDQLSNDYIADGYNNVSNSSRSLSREQSSSAPLMREAPMLNLPYADKSVKMDLQGTHKKLEVSKKAPKSDTNISNEIINCSQSCLIPERSQCGTSDHSQQEFLQNDYSHSFKIKSNIHDSGKTKRPDLRTQRSAGNIPESKHIHTISPAQNKLNSHENQKPIIRQQQKQALPRNSQERNNGISEKSSCPLSPKTVEDRKLRLKKMLSRGESDGASRMANQIMEKWNSTQKSIIQRKEKMLASIRDTRNGETERIPIPESKDILKRSQILNENRNTQLSNHQADHQFIQENEDRLCIENGTALSDGTALPSTYETQPTLSASVSREDETSSYEKEDFETTIVMPGSRIPQPYSSTNILDPSDRHLDESLSPYTSEDTPEKPLCESLDSGILALPFDNNLRSDMANDQSRVQTTILDLDEEIPERDLSISSPTESLKIDKTSPETYINVRSSISDVDSTYGSTRSNGSNNGSSICSRVHSLSIEAVYSDENEVITQTTISSIPLIRNTQEAVLSKKRNALTKSATYSRSTSHERCASRRSKASSSGSSRRSVEPSGRPPSRKPHMIDTSEEESDQEIVNTSSPFHIECYNRNTKEPLKKTPTCRMYSTLNHTPHSGQESIKTAIRDLDGVREDVRSSSPAQDRPMSSGQCSSRGGFQSCSSRPSSGRPNMPKMSPGSVKILKEKSRNNPQRCGTPVNINVRENHLESRNSKLSPWTQSTMRQESLKESSSPPQRRSRSTNAVPPSKTKKNEKPPFRYFARNKNDEEDIWNLQKLRSITVNKTIENYKPPWERVDLTPPESALRERASNERRLGITSRVTARTQNVDPYQRRIGSSTPRGGSVSPVSAATSGSRTPIGGRSIIGSRTPVRSRTPIVTRTSVGGRTPAGGRSPVDGRTPVGRGSPISCRSPMRNASPAIGSRTPIRNRTPNPPERRNQFEQRMVADRNSSRPIDEKNHQQTRNLARKYN